MPGQIRAEAAVKRLTSVKKNGGYPSIRVCFVNGLHEWEVRFWFVFLSVFLISVGSWVVIRDVACMKKVDLPPTSGIDVLFVVLVITPFSVVSVLLSLLGKDPFSTIKQKLLYCALGAHLFYLFLCGKI